jgi:hypothetical protein
MADQWVVVSIASNGQVHVWGKNRQPFPTVGKAASFKKGFIEYEARELLPYSDDKTPSRFVVCKILGTDPPEDING